MKGQYSVTYMALFILMSVVFMGGILTLGNIFEENVGEEVTDQLTENIAMRINKVIVDIRIMDNRTSVGYITKEVEIPKRIGDNSYTIIGDYNKLRIQTHGKNSLIGVYNVSWWDANVTGSSFSSNQKATLNYSAEAHKITLS